jgi:hypothetical protein
MIFTFWVHDTARAGDREEVPESVAAWSEHLPSMTWYSDADVLPILDSSWPSYADLYRRIRIPACKSDLARLLLLFNFGGLYVDSHVGPGNTQKLVHLYARLATHEVVFFDKTWEHTSDGDICMMNSVICARKSSPVIKRLIESAFHNLQEHERKEHEAQCYVAYNIFALTGAWDIRVKLFEIRDHKLTVRPAFADSVHLVRLERDDDHGYVLYQHYSYRKKGQHWSERQDSELLFIPREADLG